MPLPGANIAGFKRRATRFGLLATASALALSVGLIGPASARSLFGGANAATPVTTAVDASMAAVQQAQQATARSRSALSAAVSAIQAMQATQAAARSAAAAAKSSVPNGLAPGGLQVAPNATDPIVWQGANLPTQSSNNGQTTVTVVQTTQKAILTWSSFNVGTNTQLYFNQSAGNQTNGNNDWVALNRVTDPSGAPSQILGQIKAEGSVYLINQNGIIFGGTSQINVGSLVASTLNITNQQFLAGIINPTALDPANPATPKLLPPSFSSTNNTPGVAGSVTVEAGAQIQTVPSANVTTGGGSVYLLGSNVSNSGMIVTPDGQAVLAAGQSVYLTQSTDPEVRGVEVNLASGGTVTNTAQGLIIAPTGNISLVGLNVKQAGGLLATTSVNEAGSISLIAHDGVQTTSNGAFPPVFFAIPVRFGTVEFSSGSTTAILPEEDGLTALDGQPQAQSLIRAEGLTVDVLGGAQLVAPSGKVSLEASNNPLAIYVQDHPNIGLNASPSLDAARLYVADGAVIDVSGLLNVWVPASDDVIDVNVQSNELRDSPLNRSGILLGQDVWVNTHNLDTVASDRIYTAGGLLEVSGWLGLIPRSIDERLTSGGSVSVYSTGDAILRPGALIDIAGGSVFHQAGFVNDTRLIGADGRLYVVNQAPADMTYVAVCCNFTVEHSHWGVKDIYVNPLLNRPTFQPAYVEGKNAGSLSIVASEAEADAQVDANAINGIFQRTADSMAQNGSLTIGQGATLPSNVIIRPTVIAPVDVFADSTVTGGVRDPVTLLPADWQNTLFLSAYELDAARFGSITINSNSGFFDPKKGTTTPGGISLTDGAVLKVADGGSISLITAGAISLAGQLIVHAGSVNLTTHSSTTPLTPVDVTLKPGAIIDVSGSWTNDSLAGGLMSPALYDGGDVTIDAYGGITVGAGALIDASSGGWMQMDRTLKTSGGLPVGTGGNITLATNYQTVNSVPLPSTYPSHLTLAGTVRSFGLTAGGQLSLVTPDIQIGGMAPLDHTVLWLQPSFFSSGGFGAYSLISYRGLSIASGTDIELHAQVLRPGPSTLAAPTGSSVFSLATPQTPELYQQAPAVNLTLSALDPFSGTLVVGEGATINADPGADISLHASHQLTFDGVIDAPGGTINLDLYGLVQSSRERAAPTNYDPSTTLWIGGDAQLLAAGLVQNFLDASGRPGYRLWDGGSVNINQNGANPASTRMVPSCKPQMASTAVTRMTPLSWAASWPGPAQSSMSPVLRDRFRRSRVPEVCHSSLPASRWIRTGARSTSWLHRVCFLIPPLMHMPAAEAQQAVA
jgi:filamentous hemagglutinin